MASINMRVLIEEDHYPDLYAKLSEAKHPRARAAMLRRLAWQGLIRQGGMQVSSERGSTAQSQAQARTTREDRPNTIATPSLEKHSDELRLSAYASSALIASWGKYLA
jgi:hypothetical protein